MKVQVDGNAVFVAADDFNLMTVNLHDTMDAQIWVAEWMKTIKEHPGIPTDEGAMLGWFANAIMAGYDAAQHGMHVDSAFAVDENVGLLAGVGWA
jgi:uncharacterized protein (DUF608 family)